MDPEQDVQALIANTIDDAGAARLRNAFLGGQLPAQLAIACEMVDGWVWSENPVHLADLCGESFARSYGELRSMFGSLQIGDERMASYRLSRWIAAVRDAHQDGSLPLVHHAVLQSTSGWTWDGDMEVKVGGRETGILEEIMDDAAYASQLGAPDRVGYEIVGRLFRACTVGFKRAVLELYIDEYVRWTAAYPGYPIPPFATSRGLRLGSWVGRMRRRAALGLLDADAFLLLSSVPGWSWGIFEPFVADSVEAE